MGRETTRACAKQQDRSFSRPSSCGKLLHMSNITNLNQFRKQQLRAKKRAQGTENAVKYGRSKGQKTLEEREMGKAARDLDGHAREGDE